MWLRRAFLSQVVTVGFFFYCLLVNSHSRYLYLQTLRKGLKSQDRIFPY